MEHSRIWLLAGRPVPQDMYSRNMVGWDLANHMRSELVINALKKAIDCRKLSQGLIIHSDGGGQYASEEFRTLLKKHDFQQSMTRKGNHRAGGPV